MKPRNRTGHRLLLILAGVAGLGITFQAIVNGPAPAHAAPGDPAQAVIQSPFDQPPFSNFGQGGNGDDGGGGFSSQPPPDLRTSVS
jgi:hypothetical protein